MSDAQTADPAGEADIGGERRHWMAVLARGDAATIDAMLEACPALPTHRRLRGPEAGLIMLRGRAGGGGAAFNLGEMTVARCSVHLPGASGGHVGHAWIIGRDLRAAELAAVLDAALQDDAHHDVLMRRVVAPLDAAQQARRTADAARAAATRVDFFTMATMRS